MECVFCGAIPCVCYQPEREPGSQEYSDWEDVLEEFKRDHAPCDKCGCYFRRTMLYDYGQKTFVGVFESVPVSVRYDYKLCSSCLFSLISWREF